MALGCQSADHAFEQIALDELAEEAPGEQRVGDLVDVEQPALRRQRIRELPPARLRRNRAWGSHGDARDQARETAQRRLGDPARRARDTSAARDLLEALVPAEQLVAAGPRERDRDPR